MIIVECRFPIPRLDDVLDMMVGATIFSRINLKISNHQAMIRPGDDWKTDSKAKSDLSNWVVMPFEPPNVSSIFMSIMTLVLGIFMENFVETPKEVSTDPEKLRSRVEWSVPASAHRVRNFLGLATFCRKLIRGIRAIVAVIAGCCVKDIKEHLPDLGKTFQTFIQGPSSTHSRHTLPDGYLIKDNQLCIPRTSLRFLVWETQVGGLAGHFGRNKVILMIEDQFFWPSLEENSSELSDIFLKELPMKSVKEHPPDAKRILIEFSDGFPDEVPVPDPPWRGIGIDFVLGLLEAQKSPPGMILCNSRALFRGFLIWQIPWPWLETFV